MSNLDHDARLFGSVSWKEKYSGDDVRRAFEEVSASIDDNTTALDAITLMRDMIIADEWYDKMPVDNDQPPLHLGCGDSKDVVLEWKWNDPDIS